MIAQFPGDSITQYVDGNSLPIHEKQQPIAV
jgi:hypothetical protein